MSVYTVVDSSELNAWLTRFANFISPKLSPIAAGITNTNYFLDCTNQRFVLTLFESLTLDELKFYLELMQHLANAGVLCPAPIADKTGALASILSGKPACIVNCLQGKEVDKPNAAQCYAVGEMLAKMHLSGANFLLKTPNPRGPVWWNKTAKQLYAKLPSDEALLLHEEITLQQQNQALCLPSGVIHADLFKDNVLMDGNKVGGFIDLYYACNDFLLYDLAITLNDWAVMENGDINTNLARNLLAGYQSLRTLNLAEISAWPLMLRAAALRFWTSRLFDWYNPTLGALTYQKDPQVFKRIILKHRSRSQFWL